MSTLSALSYRVARPLLRRRPSSPKPLDASLLKKILIIRPEKIGDVFVSLPVCDALLNRYPHLKLYFLASPKSVELVNGDPRFARVFMYRKNAIADIKELYRMRQERFDCVIDMVCDDSVTSLLLAHLCAHGSPIIGQGKREFRRYYDFNHEYRTPDGAHVIDNTLKILDTFGIDSTKAEPFAKPFIDRRAAERVDKFLTAVLGESGDVCKVGVNLSAGSPNRRWGRDKLTALVRKILGDCHNAQVILLTAPEDHDNAELLRSIIGDGAVHVAPKMNLREVSALVSRFDILITPDTALVHIARSFDVPVVGLYSRFMENYQLWRPYGQDVGVVVSRNETNIFDITVEHVMDAFEQLLGIKRPVSR
jgi:ADP-heptose:LPS heptosyltransferase